MKAASWGVGGWGCEAILEDVVLYLLRPMGVISEVKSDHHPFGGGKSNKLISFYSLVELSVLSEVFLKNRMRLLYSSSSF